jgi:hypothetical protein
MGAYVTKDSINLREELAGFYKPKYAEKPTVTWFAGDGSTTDFELEAGLEPYQVFDAGALQKEGSGDEYTVADNGFTKTIVFSVAPTSLNDIAVYSWVKL